jgi:hypothetical protein
MKRLSAYFTAYFGLFSLLIQLGNVHCSESNSTKAVDTESVSLAVGDQHFVTGDYEYDENCTALYVSNQGWGTETEYDAETNDGESGASYSLGTINNPYPTIDEAIDARRADHAGSAVCIYIEGASATGGASIPYSINIIMDTPTTDDSTYFVGVNLPTITPAAVILLTQHTFEFNAGVSDNAIVGIIVEGMGGGAYPGNPSDTETEAAAISINSSGPITLEALTTITKPYSKGIRVTGSGGHLVLDTVSLTDPTPAASTGYSVAIIATSDTTVEATDVTITDYEIGFTAYGSTQLTLTDSDGSHPISGADMAAVYLTPYDNGSAYVYPTATITRLGSSETNPLVYSRGADSLTLEDVTGQTGATIRLCNTYDSYSGARKTVANTIAAINNSSIQDLEVGEITYSGSGNSISTLALDPDASGSITTVTTTDNEEMDYDDSDCAGL